MWRPRGERGLSSCRSRFITLARASSRRRGLRSRGAGSPMTNVPVSLQQAPPGPATPSAQQVPGECLRVSVSGKELLKAQSLQKGHKDSSSCPRPRSPGRCHRRGVLPGGGGGTKRISGIERAIRAAGFLPPRSSSIPHAPCAEGLGRAPGEGPGLRAGQAAWSPSQRCSGSRFVPECANVARAARASLRRNGAGLGARGRFTMI